MLRPASRRARRTSRGSTSTPGMRPRGLDLALSMAGVYRTLRRQDAASVKPRGPVLLDYVPGPVLSARTEMAVTRNTASVKSVDRANLRMKRPPPNAPPGGGGNCTRYSSRRVGGQAITSGLGARAVDGG